MANTDLVVMILETASSFFVYMLPVIGILAGLNFVVSWVMSLTMGMGKRTFRG